jgi:hypothetical protein
VKCENKINVIVIICRRFASHFLVLTKVFVAADEGEAHL